MRSPVASFLLAASLVAATASAQQPPPAPPAAPPPSGYAPAPYAAPPPWGYAPYAAPPYHGPWAPLPEVPVTERRSKGMMVTGIALWALGGVATGVGGTLVGLAITHPCVYAVDAGVPTQIAAHGERIGVGRQALNSCDAPGTVGLGLLTAGVITGIVAIPLFVVGNSRARVKAQPLAAAPELRVGPTGAEVRWTF